MSRIVKKSIPLLILLTLIGGGVYFYQKSKVLSPEQMYRLQPISQGDVVQTVSANGTLNPVTLINVGAQVSGRVNKLFVDFNDHVEKNQILLTLEPELFDAQIGQSQGNVRNAQASVELAIANEARMRTLFTQDYASKQDLDQAVQALKSARAQLETARGQLLRDNTNLSYSIIRSPVSGVVVDRVVDVGQTVAASFQTPTLIKIALIDFIPLIGLTAVGCILISDITLIYWCMLWRLASKYGNTSSTQKSCSSSVKTEVGFLYLPAITCKPASKNSL